MQHHSIHSISLNSKWPALILGHKWRNFMVKKPVQKAAASVKKSAAKAKAKPAVKNVSNTATDVADSAHKVLLAGVGAAQRFQAEAVKAYGAIATQVTSQAETLRAMSSDVAAAIAKKTSSFAKDGQKMQAQAQAVAMEKAEAAAKEMKNFAAKSEKSFKSNVEHALNTTVANAREGVTKLEHVFEARVAKTLNTFGVPSSQNIKELQARMADLQKALTQLKRKQA
jgi:poly(hydroxyalkanoate) granule-associated protein